ncbi:hypothetical protein B0H17DRAFT_1203024 [Mycena rosella]|uniref:WKF domain-containing protein n=1 Tax=Mycena rosella TaxID=1033263 RepID=A0AAD7GCX3_MYCRO|nr:hypothetical protein B0H17DRAFT_1203024 [Mycena rosella]
MTEKLSKKEKSEKREKRGREETVAEDINPSVNDEPQKKKHKKNKTGFPDPEDDSSTLSEQALKALSYAFLQFRKPAKWKFSKARQNWLIRNIWSDMIPDTYLPLTIRYLSNVKGGVRETLIKDCRSILSPTPPDKPTSIEPKASETEAVSLEVAAKIDELKLARARALLDALETPDSQADPKSDTLE